MALTKPMVTAACGAPPKTVCENLAPIKLTSLAVVILAAGLAGAASAQSFDGGFDFVEPSSSGSFLAARSAETDRREDYAANYYLDALEHDWDNPFLVDRAFTSSAAAGHFDTAEGLAQRLVDLDPNAELARLTLGAMALKERRYSSAIQLLEPMQPQTLAGITGNALRAWALLGAGRNDEAYDLVESIDQPGFTEFLRFHRGLMADVAGDREKALPLLAGAYETDPFVFRIVEAYVRALANGGDFDKAAEVLDEFEARGISHPYIDLVGDAVDRKVRPGKFAVNVQEGAAELMHGLGTALGANDTTELSLVFMRLALLLDPEADMAAITLGEMLDHAERYESANEVYEKISVNSPLRINAVIKVAENLEQLGDLDEAIRELGNIATANPDSVDAAIALGNLLRADEQYVEAADYYGRGIEITGGESPSDWRYYYLRGIAYERAKQWEDAEPDFLRSLELFPDQPQVLNYLGYSWVDQGLHLERALSMIEKAVDLRPNDGYIIDSLGWAYYRLGRYEEAVETLERAVLISPGEATLNDHLGDAYWQVGRKREARFQWMIARDLGPEEDGALEEIERKIEFGLDTVLADAE